MYENALTRQIAAFPRAPGLNKEQMITMWRDFSTFGTKSATPVFDQTGEVPMKFFAPTTKIHNLRKIAAKGHLRLEQLAKKEKGKKKVVHLTDPEFFKAHHDVEESAMKPTTATEAAPSREP